MRKSVTLGLSPPGGIDNDVTCCYTNSVGLEGGKYDQKCETGRDTEDVWALLKSRRIQT